MKHIMFIEVIQDNVQTLFTVNARTIQEAQAVPKEGWMFHSIKHLSWDVPDGTYYNYVFGKDIDGNASPMLVADLILIQAEQLDEWEEVLKSNVYEDLLKWVAMQNKGLKTASEVVRGSALDCFVKNWLHHRDKLLEDKM